MFKEKLCDIIRESESFRSTEVVDPDDQSGAQAAIKVAYRAVRIYAFFVFVTGAVAIFSPIVLGSGQTLPFAVWMPKNQPYAYEVISIHKKLCS